MTPTRQRLLFIGLIIIGLAFVVFFGVRLVHAFKEFNGHRPRHFPPPHSQPAETDVTLIRDWMTIGYLSEAYQLPPNLLYEALNIPPNGNEHKSLKQLNDKYYPQQSGVVLEKVKAAILANQPPPAPIAPDAPTPPATAIPPINP
jgi:hypothetical protein